MQACYTRGIGSSILFVNMIFFLPNMLKLGACAQLTIKRRFCLLSLAGYQSHSIGPFINKSSPYRMLPHLHQNIILQWKHQIQSSKEKAVIIKIEGGQVSIEKLRYVFLTTYALSKTKHPNIHITKRMTLRVFTTNQTQPSRHPKHTEPTSVS
jgi:hypothetical protein